MNNGINKKNKILNIIFPILLIVLIILGVFLRVDVAKGKEYFHMDEVYSQGLINYRSVQLSENKDLYNTVHNKEYFKDYIEVSEEERLDFKTVVDRQLEDVHPPFYYFLLKIFTNFNLNNFSKWPGIILNIFAYTISAVLIYLITLKLSKNRIISLILVLLYSISVIAIEHVIFIRMYELVNMLTLLYTYLFIKVLLNDSKNINIGSIKCKSVFCNLEKTKKTQYILLGLITIIGVLTHYYFTVYVFATYILAIIYFFKNERKDDAITMTFVFVISGIIYLLSWPLRFENIFGRASGSEIGFIELLKGFIKSINSGYLNIIITASILAFLKVINIILEKFRNKKEANDENKDLSRELKYNRTITTIILISSIFYILVTCITAPFIAGRYVYPVLSLLSMSFIILIYFNTLDLIRNIFISNNMKALKCFVITSVLLILLIPQFLNLKQAYSEGFEFQYRGKAESIRKLEDLKDIPLIYIYDGKQYFNIIDDVYMLSKVEESIIIPRLDNKEPKISTSEYLENIKENIDKIYENGDLLVLTHHWYNEEILSKDKATKYFESKEIKLDLENDIKTYPTQVEILNAISKHKDFKNIKHITNFLETSLFLLSK